MSNELERIQKWLAARGLGSRREIEGWIREGRLRVNGKPAELGQRISGYERLSLDGKPLRVSPEREAPRQVLMYHKPPGEICSRNDPDGRPTVFRHLPKLRQGRWVSIGRLDLNTAGLLLFTNDGELANRLMHPSAEIEREYWVRVAGEVNEDTLQALRNGLELEDGFACFDDVQPLLQRGAERRAQPRSAPPVGSGRLPGQPPETHPLRQSVAAEKPRRRTLAATYRR